MESETKVTPVQPVSKVVSLEEFRSQRQHEALTLAPMHFERQVGLDFEVMLHRENLKYVMQQLEDVGCGVVTLNLNDYSPETAETIRDVLLQLTEDELS